MSRVTLSPPCPGCVCVKTCCSSLTLCYVPSATHATKTVFIKGALCGIESKCNQDPRDTELQTGKHTRQSTSSTKKHVFPETVGFMCLQRPRLCARSRRSCPVPLLSITTVTSVRQLALLAALFSGPMGSLAAWPVTPSFHGLPVCAGFVLRITRKSTRGAQGCEESALRAVNTPAAALAWAIRLSCEPESGATKLSLDLTCGPYPEPLFLWEVLSESKMDVHQKTEWRIQLWTPPTGGDASVNSHWQLQETQFFLKLLLLQKIIIRTGG